jgi:transposase
MLDLLNQDPQVTLAKFVDLLDLEYGIEVHKSTVCRNLAELKITYKRVERTNQA